MNIFLLSYDLQECAEMHADKHVVKQILEYCQLLSGALRYHGYTYNNVYAMTHMNHPCSIWVRESRENFDYLLELTEYLANEYTYRYGKIHKSSKLFATFHAYKFLLPRNGKTDLPKCMPNHCKSDDVVNSYRNYYLTEKQHLASWKKRDAPSWYCMG